MGASLLILCLAVVSLRVSAGLKDAPDVSEVGSTYAKVRHLIGIKSVYFTRSVSSSLFVENNVESDIKCMLLCAMRDCSVASRNVVTGRCQLVMLNDDIKAASFPGSYVQRMVGDRQTDHTWKLPALDGMLSGYMSVVRPFNNSGTGSTGFVQRFMVHIAGCYRIQAYGARGGSNGKSGGNGAMVSGVFKFAVGTDLSIAVGQQGGIGGGGGGTFVYRTSDNRLLLAAGGGGAGSEYTAGHPGQKGTAGTDTTPCGFCNPAYKGFGGAKGLAGFINMAAARSDYQIGGAGAGWVGKSTVGRRSSKDGESGGGRADGWVGGQSSSKDGFGGFGGGGGPSKDLSSGGGGGFSGGGAAVADSHPGGGGGSFCANSDCTRVTGGNTDNAHGSVAIVMTISSCA